MPAATPSLPEEYSPRPSDRARILDALLAGGDDVAALAKAGVIVVGMGGLGKTTLAAAVVRDERVRGHFTRVGFVSAGQEPAVLEEQRTLHLQLARTTLEAKPDATVASQREALQDAAAKKTWLIILDDLWTAEHEQQLAEIKEELKQLAVALAKKGE